MRRWSYWLGLVGCVLPVACGDEAPQAGERLASEVVRTATVDWSFAEDLPLAALQTSHPPRSRAVWIVVRDDALYVPTGFVPADWAADLEEDPVVLLRLMDRLYLRRATRVTDRARLAILWQAVRDKYASPPSDGADDGPEEGTGETSSGWIFRMDPVDGHG